MTKQATIGSISHGTMRVEDLLPEFLFALEDLEHPKAQRVNSELIERGFGYSQCGVCFGDRDEWPEDFTDDDANEIIDEMIDALNEHAPPYCYFGAHPGDGSDFGFWPDMDSLEELDKYNDLSEVPEDQDDDFIIVNDHGNMTLYGGDGKEIWAIV